MSEQLQDEQLGEEETRLREAIAAAFGNWRPSREILEKMQSAYEYDERIGEVVYSLLRDKTWKDLSPRELHFLSPVFLGDDVFTYWLPAYLSAALTDDCDWEVVCSTANRIAQPWKKGTGPKFRMRTDWFSSDQRQCIRDVLSFFAENCFATTCSVRRRVETMVRHLGERQGVTD